MVDRTELNGNHSNDNSELQTTTSVNVGLLHNLVRESLRNAIASGQLPAPGKNIEPIGISDEELKTILTPTDADTLDLIKASKEKAAQKFPGKGYSKFNSA